MPSLIREYLFRVTNALTLVPCTGSCFWTNDLGKPYADRNARHYCPPCRIIHYAQGAHLALLEWEVGK